ncbi:MAG: peptidoglycan-binding protein [Phycisphaerae bacterium]
MPDENDDLFGSRVYSLLKATKPGAAPPTSPPPGSAAAQTATTSQQQADPAPPEPQPVGTGDYIVKAGDCISSIAKEAGHFWLTIWDDAGNSEVKTAREDPNVLMPGDRLVIPPFEEKEESIAPEQRHRFKRKGEPAKFRVRLMENDKPVANKPYKFDIDGKMTEGTTDPEGLVEVSLPGNAKRGKLMIEGGQTYAFEFGQLEPINTLKGVQERLKNLGYDIDACDGKQGPKTRDAVLEFQRKSAIEPSGDVDQGTRDALELKHGS